MRKGFGALALILAVIVLIMVIVFLMGIRIVFDPSTMSFQLAFSPEGTFSWLAKWLGG